MGFEQRAFVAARLCFAIVAAACAIGWPVAGLAWCAGRGGRFGVGKRCALFSRIGLLQALAAATTAEAVAALARALLMRRARQGVAVRIQRAQICFGRVAGFRRREGGKCGRGGRAGCGCCSRGGRLRGAAAFFGRAFFANALHHLLARGACGGGHYGAAWGLACASPQCLAAHGNGFGHFACFGAEAVYRLHGDLLLRKALNRLHEAFFVQADKAHGLALGARAACAANAVHVVFGYVGNFVVHHMGQVVNVDAACGNVGGYQGAQSAASEVGQRLGARALAFVAVQGHGADALFVEEFGHLVGAEFRARKYQHLVPAVLLNDVGQQVFFAVAAYGVNGLGNALRCGVARRNLHLLRVAQQGGCQFANLVAESGRKQQALLVCRQQCQYFFHVVDKAHVEHAVGLIQHQYFHARQVQRTLPVQVQQAPGSGYQNVYAFLQALDLRLHAYAAKNHGGFQAQVLAVIAH